MRGPLAGLSASLAALGGEVSLTESRHLPTPQDYYYLCKHDQPANVCLKEMRQLACSSGTMEPRSYALCLRCVASVTPDNAECAALAKLTLVSGEIAAPLIGPVFIGNGTADPPNHPPVGAPPPLHK